MPRMSASISLMFSSTACDGCRSPSAILDCWINHIVFGFIKVHSCFAIAHLHFSLKSHSAEVLLGFRLRLGQCVRQLIASPGRVQSYSQRGSKPQASAMNWWAAL